MALKKLELNPQILGMAQVVQNFLERLRTDDSIAADLGRLKRIYAILTETTETKRVQMLWVVSEARHRWPLPPERVRFGLFLHVDQAFEALTDEQIESAFSNKRWGVAAIAARLSAHVPTVFGDNASDLANVADKFDKAESALAK